MNWVKISKIDNIGVALRDLPAGMQLENVKLIDRIPRGHKFALTAIPENANVIKYGSPIGIAVSNIPPGQHVHIHNIRTTLDKRADYEYQPVQKVNNVQQVKDTYFQGYLRSNGSVGTRNEIWIINTVGCVNKTAEKILAAAKKKTDSCCDGIFTFSHPYGCSQLGKDHEATARILADLVEHPNAGGVLVLGLGCENNNIESFKKLLKNPDENRIKFLNAQDVHDEIQAGANLIGQIADTIKNDKRTKCPVSKLVVGLKCGGSDGLSGITANPLLGCLSDRIIQSGATSILTEVPEMFGAEKLLMNRCLNKNIFDKTVELINNFKEYYTSYGQPVYENPSPGNKDGGITTLEDKSLGCIQKGGTSPVVDVIKYSEKVNVPGLNLLEGPGNDIVSTTAMTAAGANLILFTTGRGTPLGTPVPTIKVASNSEIAHKKNNWIDFDAGVIVEGKSIDEVCSELIDLAVNVASGLTTCNERNDYREIAIFKKGVTL